MTEDERVPKLYSKSFKEKLYDLENGYDLATQFLSPAPSIIEHTYRSGWTFVKHVFIRGYNRWRIKVMSLITKRNKSFISKG